MLKRASFYFGEVAFKGAIRKKNCRGETNVGIWIKNNVTGLIPRKPRECREKCYSCNFIRMAESIIINRNYLNRS